MKHIFSTTIIVLGLTLYLFGVGSFLISTPDESISRFLMLLGGITALIGIRMQRLSDPTLVAISKTLAVIGFFVFIGCTLIALVIIFSNTPVSMFIMVFSLGCAILTAFIHGMMEIAAAPRA